MMMALKKETMATTMVMSIRIEELELKDFVGTMYAYDVDNFLWKMENYFHAKGITDDAVKGRFYPEIIEEEARAKLQGITQRGTVGEYVQEFKELMLQVSNVIEKEVLIAFRNGLKS
ncbi:hypothetical protein Goklo_002894 [Gossypium klotzschianum]|uniref:Retrotransposon gag domain-containing protein n=1 Tax=Gossypium klotzschianum TaxID=34286 RepID=A0A7J8VUN2_9ROSI|nr:hypothetical protein [Gossypium klotzschianum]